MGQNGIKEMELGYWRYRGFGHPLRYILEYLSLPYHEKNYYLPSEGVGLTGKNWLEERDKLRRTYPSQLPFPSLPYLIDGAEAVVESRAIMRYIARTYAPQLLGSSPTIQNRVEELESFLYDFWYIDFCGVIYQNTRERLTHFNTEKGTKLDLISKFVGDNVWATGPELTLVDFWLAEFLIHLTIFDAAILKPLPNLKRLRDNFKLLPAIERYMSSPTFIKEPCYSPRAVLKF